jgi:hypothetical protein
MHIDLFDVKFKVVTPPSTPKARHAAAVQYDMTPKAGRTVAMPANTQLVVVISRYLRLDGPAKLQYLAVAKSEGE